jgi:hypothetical protein
MKSNIDYKQALDKATQHYFTSSNNLGYASIFGHLDNLHPLHFELHLFL